MDVGFQFFKFSLHPRLYPRFALDTPANQWWQGATMRAGCLGSPMALGALARKRLQIAPCGR